MTTRRKIKTVNTDRVIRVGREDGAEDGVAVVVRGGRAVLVPRMLRNLSRQGDELVEELQGTAMALEAGQERLDKYILAARAEGLSWNAIGWCVGLTGQAVRKRLSE